MSVTPLIYTTGSSYNYPCVNVAHSRVEQFSSVSSLSSSWKGTAFTTVLGPVDVGDYENYTITIVNNAHGNILSGVIQSSPNGTNWATVDAAAVLLTSSGGIFSASYSDKSYKYLRIQCVASGTGGDFTGSIDAYITMNQ